MEGMTTTYLWIAIAVIVLILLAIVLVVLGKKRGESKKVSFDKPVEEPKELTQQQKSGNYQAKSGFNFAPAGGSAEKQPAKAQPTQAAQAQPDKNGDKRDATELANAQLNGTQKTEKNEKPAKPEKPAQSEKPEPAEPVKAPEKAKEAEAPQEAQETKNDEGSESAALSLIHI